MNEPAPSTSTSSLERRLTIRQILALNPSINRANVSYRVKKHSENGSLIVEKPTGSETSRGKAGERVIVVTPTNYHLLGLEQYPSEVSAQKSSAPQYLHQQPSNQTIPTQNESTASLETSMLSRLSSGSQTLERKMANFEIGGATVEINPVEIYPIGQVRDWLQRINAVAFDEQAISAALKVMGRTQGRPCVGGSKLIGYLHEVEGMILLSEKGKKRLATMLSVGEETLTTYLTGRGAEYVKTLPGTVCAMFKREVFLE